LYKILLYHSGPPSLGCRFSVLRVLTWFSNVMVETRCLIVNDRTLP
jgi:hypothetical protein